MRISDWSSDVCSSDLLTDRCSGHGGKWGIFKQNFDTAVKVGRPAARAMAKNDPDYMVSECPLAGPHLKQVMELSGASKVPDRIGHPIEVMAKAYEIGRASCRESACQYV